MSIGTPITVDGFAVGVICREPMEEYSRTPDGDERWCFVCRKRTTFERVIDTPTGMSYYGPTIRIECTRNHHTDGDMFPGGYRTWGDD